MEETSINIAIALCVGLAVCAVLALAWAYLVFVISRQFIWPRPCAVPWTGGQLLALVLLVQFFLPILVALGIRKSGTLDYLVGPRPDTAATSEAPEQTSDEENATVEKSLRRERESMWIAGILYPINVATIVGLLAIVSGARPADMGLTTRRLGWTELLGFLGWILLTPLVLLLNVSINLLYRSFTELKEEEHPVMRLLRAEPGTLEVVLIVFTAVIAAPVLEELLFRGVLQPWFAGGQKRGWIALAAALAYSAWQRSTKMQGAWTDSGLLAAMQEGMAIAFVALLVPGYFLARWLGAAVANFTITPPHRPEPPRPAELADRIQIMPRAMSGTTMDPVEEAAREVASRARQIRWANQAGGIYATSALFAAAHSFAWPTPISLFVLALGLGYLVCRTQSILGSITLHAMFNGLSCVVLLLAPHTIKGEETTSAAPMTPPAVNSTRVPGS